MLKSHHCLIILLPFTLISDFDTIYVYCVWMVEMLLYMMVYYLLCISALIGMFKWATWEYYFREQFVVEYLPAVHRSWEGHEWPGRRCEGLVKRINEGPIDKPPSQCWAHGVHSVFFLIN